MQYQWSISNEDLAKMLWNFLKTWLLFVAFYLLGLVLKPENAKTYTIIISIVTLGLFMYSFLSFVIYRIVVDAVRNTFTVEKKSYFFYKKIYSTYNLNEITTTLLNERISKNIDGKMTLKVYRNNTFLFKINEIDFGWNVKMLNEIHEVIKKRTS